MGELAVTEEDYVIAVDGGLSYCGLLNVEPDLIILYQLLSDRLVIRERAYSDSPAS